MRVLAPLALALAVALAAPAGATYLADDLAVADAYWGPHPCAGAVVVLGDATLPARGLDGEATGLAAVWDGAAWHWYVARCEVTIAPHLTGVARCRIVVHEVGHLVHGAGHEGPMHPGRLNPTACVPPEPTGRRAVSAAIRDALPVPRATWRIACAGPDHRLTCRVWRPGARVRLYRASASRNSQRWERVGRGAWRP